jgi:plasmid stabilization system protein ParE
MKVVWSERSLLRLAEIQDYIARDNPVAAERFIGKLVGAVVRLADYPMIGRRIPRVTDASVRESVVDHYRIPYRVREAEIVVLTVFESHRLLRDDELR